MNKKSEYIAYLNKILKVEDLLEEYAGVEVHGGHTIHCPFHNDERKSAKFYKDNAVYCFAESKMYRPYDILLHYGVSFAEMQKRWPTDLDFTFEPEKRIIDREYWRLREKLNKEKFSLDSVIKGWMEIAK